MLIPIGKEDNEVLRHPVVSYALFLLNVLVAVFMLTSSQEQALHRQAQQLREIGEYLLAHPYLEVPDLGGYADVEFMIRIDRARKAYAREHGTPDEETRERAAAGLAELLDQIYRDSAYDPFAAWGYIPSRPSLVTLFTAMFVHAGWLHLLGNMLFLYIAGPAVEDAFGRPLFAALYLFSGVVATLAHAASFPQSTVPLVGASGAIAGIMGAFLVRRSRERIRFLFLPMPLFPVLRYTFFLPAFVVLPLWLGEQLLLALVASEGSGVAFWAHVGGFAFGAAAALVVRFAKVEERWVRPAIEKEIMIVAHPGLEQASEARARGELKIARTAVGRVLRDEPENPDGWREAYEVASASADPDEITRTATRSLEIYQKLGEHELAATLVSDVEQRGQTPPPKFFLAAAESAERLGNGTWAVSLLARVTEANLTDSTGFRAVYRQAQILKRLGDVPAAREAYARARAHPACTDAFQQAIARALVDLESAARTPAGSANAATSEQKAP